MLEKGPIFFPFEEILLRAIVEGVGVVVAIIKTSFYFTSKTKINSTFYVLSLSLSLSLSVGLFLFVTQ